MDKLNKDGFIIFKNVLNYSQGIDCIDKDKVNYDKMSYFVQNMIDIVNSRLNVNMKYIKYRVSDNNNSVDAGAMHRDIQCQDPNISKTIKCFTCLTYLDPTTMEILPGSHNMLSMSFIQAYKLFNKIQRIKMNRGDVMLFYSTILHRGIFTEKLKHRRLVQVFDVYSDINIFKNFYHLKGSEKFANSMISLFKNRKTSAVLNLYGYFNAACGYGYLKIPNFNISYLSSEGLCHRLEVESNTMQPINKYIIMNKNIDTLPDKYNSDVKYTLYTRQYILYSLLILIVFFILALIIYTIVMYKF
jgi:hypothetical protein